MVSYGHTDLDMTGFWSINYIGHSMFSDVDFKIYGLSYAGHGGRFVNIYTSSVDEALSIFLDIVVNHLGVFTKDDLIKWGCLDTFQYGYVYIDKVGLYARTYKTYAELYEWMFEHVNFNDKFGNKLIYVGLTEEGFEDSPYKDYHFHSYPRSHSVSAYKHTEFLDCEFDRDKEIKHLGWILLFFDPYTYERRNLVLTGAYAIKDIPMELGQRGYESNKLHSVYIGDSARRVNTWEQAFEYIISSYAYSNEHRMELMNLDGSSIFGASIAPDIALDAIKDGTIRYAGSDPNMVAWRVVEDKDDFIKRMTALQAIPFFQSVLIGVTGKGYNETMPLYHLEHTNIKSVQIGTWKYAEGFEQAYPNHAIIYYEKERGKRK